jgi:hypothetical protein
VAEVKGCAKTAETCAFRHHYLDTGEEQRFKWLKDRRMQQLSREQKMLQVPARLILLPLLTLLILPLTLTLLILPAC